MGWIKPASSLVPCLSLCTWTIYSIDALLVQLAFPGKQANVHQVESTDPLKRISRNIWPRFQNCWEQWNLTNTTKKTILVCHISASGTSQYGIYMCSIHESDDSTSFEDDKSVLWESNVSFGLQYLWSNSLLNGTWIRRSKDFIKSVEKAIHTTQTREHQTNQVLPLNCGHHWHERDTKICWCL